MKNFLPKVDVRKYGTYVAVVVIFVHNYVIDRDVPCTCEKGDAVICSLYMSIPFFILLILQLWTDKKFQRIFKYLYRCDKKCERCCSCRFFMVLFYQIMKAICVGLLWVLAVLIDGDWYICCNSSYNQTYTDLACKNEKTDGDRKKISEMKHLSMKIGLIILFSGLLCIALGTAFRCRNCPSCCAGKLLYEDVVLEEGGSVRTEILRKAAKKQLINQMLQTCNNKDWETFLNAADTVLETIEEAEKKAKKEAEEETQQPVWEVLKEVLEEASQHTDQQKDGKKTDMETQTVTQQGTKSRPFKGEERPKSINTNMELTEMGSSQGGKTERDGQKQEENESDPERDAAAAAEGQSLLPSPESTNQ